MYSKTNRRFRTVSTFLYLDYMKINKKIAHCLNTYWWIFQGLFWMIIVQSFFVNYAWIVGAFLFALIYMRNRQNRFLHLSAVFLLAAYSLITGIYALMLIAVASPPLSVILLLLFASIANLILSVSDFYTI